MSAPQVDIRQLLRNQADFDFASFVAYFDGLNLLAVAAIEPAR